MYKGNLKYWELSRKYFSGNINESELGKLSEWRTESEENESLFIDFEKIYNHTDINQEYNFDPKHDWKNVFLRIQAENQSHSSSLTSFRTVIFRVAAAVLLLIGIIYSFQYFQNGGKGPLRNSIVIGTDMTEKKLVILPDSSKVWLNESTNLIYPEVFDEVNRVVYLKGEAFFDVKPDKEHPFVIYSGATKTEVLGTSFNLRAIEGEDEVKLIVVTGKVSFSINNSDSISSILTPGQYASFSNEMKNIHAGENKDANFLSWKTDQLTFKNDPIREVVAHVSRHYKINIEVENSDILNCRFTGDFNNTNIDNVVNIITHATNTSYEIIGNTYYIRGVGCE